MPILRQDATVLALQDNYHSCHTQHMANSLARAQRLEQLRVQLACRHPALL